MLQGGLTGIFQSINVVNMKPIEQKQILEETIDNLKKCQNVISEILPPMFVPPEHAAINNVINRLNSFRVWVSGQLEEREEYILDPRTGQKTGKDWKCPTCQASPKEIDNGVMCVNGHKSQ